MPRAAVEYKTAESMVLTHLVGPPARGYVDPTHHGGDGFYSVLFALSGRQNLSNRRQSMSLRPADILLYSSRTAGTFETFGVVQELQILVPMNEFERHWPGLACEDLSRVLHAGPAISAVALASVSELWKRRNEFSENELRDALTAVIDVVSRYDRSIAVVRSARSISFDDVVRYIDGDLHDPDLTPERIAQRHCCSLRSIHALFAKHGHTVAAYIRQRRLERCRQALLCEKGAERIGDVALRWGFNDAAHFSKLFRAAYGLSPRQYRRQQSS